MFVNTVVAAVVALPFVAQGVSHPISFIIPVYSLTSTSLLAAFAATCTRTYTVQQGDWCDTISAAHNVSTYVALDGILLGQGTD